VDSRSAFLARTRELELEPGLELEPVLVRAPGLGQALVPHKQASLRLTTMPAGSVNFSFSSEKLLHSDFGQLKLVYY